MPQKLRSWSRGRRRVHERSYLSSRPSNATRVHGRGGVLEGSAFHDSTHDHDHTTTPTTNGWHSDVSIILPGWSVTLVGPCQYPRYTSAAKDGRPWVAQATHRQAPQEHDLHQNFLSMKRTIDHFLLTWWRRCEALLTFSCVREMPRVFGCVG